MRRVLLVFSIMAAWDWLATVSIRFIASGALASIPIGGAITLLWWLGVVNVERNWRYGVAAVAGACVGTYLGLLV